MMDRSQTSTDPPSRELHALETAGATRGWSAFRHAPVMIQTMDSEGRLLQVNARWQQTLGYPDTTVVGRRFDSFRSEEHTSELQSLMRNSYAVFCLKKKKKYLL